MGVLGVAAIGVFAASIAISSCDLLRYDEGSLGLMHYVDEQTGACTAFVTLEDQSLKSAQSASLAAFALGALFFAISAAHEFYMPFPLKNTVLSILATIIELCLMTVYTAQSNSICEMQGCKWGSATAYLVVAQLAFVVAMVGSIYTSQDKVVPFATRTSYNSSGNDKARRSLQQLDVGLDVGNTA
jgi:hypothetical protein